MLADVLAGQPESAELAVVEQSRVGWAHRIRGRTPKLREARLTPAEIEVILMRRKKQTSDTEFLETLISSNYDDDFEKIYLDSPEGRKKARARARTAIAEQTTLGPEALDAMENLLDTTEAQSGIKGHLNLSIENSVEGARERLGRRYKRRAADIVAGMGMTGTINALTIRAPSGRPVLLFDQAAVSWLRIAMRAYRHGFQEDAIKRLTTARIMNGIIRYAATGDRRVLDEARAGYAGLGRAESSEEAFTYQAMAEYAHYFVILHEYGHALLGHLRQEHRFQSLALGRTGSSPVFVGDPELEHQADVFAASSPGANLGIRASGAVMFRIFEEAEKRTPRPISSTHPGWNQRWARLLTAIPASERQLCEYAYQEASKQMTRLHALNENGILQRAPHLQMKLLAKDRRLKRIVMES